MIYLVTKERKLFNSDTYKVIDIDECMTMLNSVDRLQFDTETSGRDPHLCKLLCMQFGNDKKDFQIVIDCEHYSPRLFKDILESKLIIGQNLKFDFQFLYNYNIIPRYCFDTMVVEQLLYLGYPAEVKRYSLKALCDEYLGVDIDKTVRGEIIWRGLDDKVVKYAAGDVLYLEKIMAKQVTEMRRKQCVKAAQIECEFVPVIAYLEWCGIKLDEEKWKEKMRKDQAKRESALIDLNAWFLKTFSNIEDERISIKYPSDTVKSITAYIEKCTDKQQNGWEIETVENTDTSKTTIFKPGKKYLSFKEKYIKVNLQGSLFDGFDTDPKCVINWASPQQVTEIAKILGFDTTVKDKKTGENKDSVLEKQLSIQKGINDEFLKYYFVFKEADKVCSSFGQGHLNAINPKTGRIHTNFKQLGAISGRMSCGGGNNQEIAAYKKLKPKDVPNLNLQQLPHDAETRSCFVAEKGNLFCSCDYAAEEARIGAMVYNEKTLIDEFLYGSGDSHAAYAKAAFPEELKDIPTKDVKKVRPDLRSKVKSLEFALQFGSDGTAAAPALGVSIEQARQFASNLLENMKGLGNFKKTSSKAVRLNGYVVSMPQTGHKTYWWDFDHWQREQAAYTSEFWDEYRETKKAWQEGEPHESWEEKPYILRRVATHFKAAAKWDRMALNVPTQGGGAVVLKTACRDLFDWIVDNGYFGKILFCVFVHDEINSEFPEELKDTYPQVVADIMQKAAAKYYSIMPIPAEPEVDTCWRH